MSNMTLTSPAFRDGEPIPRECGYTADNVNPPLRISGIPSGAETLALVVDDPDAVEPAGKVWDHWVLWNVPAERTEIPRGWDPDVGVEGANDFGERGYGGPNPPDGEHTYRFRCFAVDDRFHLAPGSTKDELLDRLEGHVLAEASLAGTFAP